MLGHRQLSAAEYLGIWRRRWKLGVVSMLLSGIAGYALTRVIPAKYVSTARVAQLVGGSSGLAPAPIDLTVSQLSALRQQTLTRERAGALAARFGLNGDGAENNSGGAVAELEKNTVVSSAVAGFTVSFTAPNPRTAQQVCAELVSLLLQEELKNLERDDQSQARAASSQRPNPMASYLAGQVEDAKRNLDQREAKLSEFRRQHAVELNASDRSAAERKIADDETHLQAADASLKTALQQRTAFTESLFAQQSAVLQDRKPADTSGTEALEEQLAAKQAQLVTLETRYTPDHPDVVKLRSDIEQLQKKIDQAKKAAGENAARKPEGGPAGEPRPTPQLQAQIHELDVLIQEKTREQERLQQEILTARARLNTGSIVDQEYRELTAESATARTLYTGLLAKQSETQQAEAAQTQQREAPLYVAVPPNLPAQPSYPNPLLFTLAGTGSGLAIGLLAMVAGEMRDKSMRTAGDVEYFLELPTLAVLPPAGAKDGITGDGGSWPQGGHMGKQREKEERVLADV